MEIKELIEIYISDLKSKVPQSQAMDNRIEMLENQWKEYDNKEKSLLGFMSWYQEQRNNSRPWSIVECMMEYNNPTPRELIDGKIIIKLEDGDLIQTFDGILTITPMKKHRQNLQSINSSFLPNLSLAENIAEIMDRHGVTCPLETNVCRKEINALLKRLPAEYK